MDNGRIVIRSEHGIETVLNPERAINLLDFLNSHRDLLWKIASQGEQASQP